MITACIAVALLLLIPDSAFAWGPITHLTHGSELLASINSLIPALQQLLANYPHHYLYGCIGADITLGKKYTRAQQLHCHSWAVGWQVLKAADSDPERAFAYGYLTHLAADVFSHNHYVPTQLIVSYKSTTMRHIYWEAHFDNRQQVTHRELVSQVRRRQFPECDRLLQRVIARTIFSFDTNKRIFNSVLALHDWSNWHTMLEAVGRRSRYALPDDAVDRYNNVVRSNVIATMNEGKTAQCQRSDPAGLSALSLATELRKALRALDRRGAITKDIERQIEALNTRLELEEDAPLSELLFAPA